MDEKWRERKLIEEMEIENILTYSKKKHNKKMKIDKWRAKSGVKI